MATNENRAWLLRTMCHIEHCKCADRGGMVDDYEACRLVSRHANAIIKARDDSSKSTEPKE